MTGAFLVAAAAFLQQISPAAGPLPASAAVAAADIERCDALLLPHLKRFERSGSALDARAALRAARAAREKLERLAVPPPLDEARREELTFFNHVIPGISRWLENPKRPGARQTLASVLRRGRTHRERGRTAMKRN